MLKKIIMAMLVMGIASAVMAQNHYMLTGQLSDMHAAPQATSTGCFHSPTSNKATTY